MTTTISGSSGGTAVTTTTLTALIPPSPSPPQGRLTLTSATPVLISTVSAATTIYYALHTGNQIPIYSGSAWAMSTFTELSNATAQSSTGSAGPAVVANNSNYDLFVWSNSGTLTLTRGPLWTSDTGRGTGAGTTQISRVLGYWSNTVAITNGPGAGLGTYVGTVRSNGTATIDWTLTPAAATYGSNPTLGVYNAYNRVRVSSSTTAASNWTYSTATWRTPANANLMRVNYIDGLAQSYIDAAYNMPGNPGGAGVGIGLNQNAITGIPRIVNAMAGGINNESFAWTVNGVFPPLLGYGYVTAMEIASAAGLTFYGDTNGAGFGIGVTNGGLSVNLEM